MKNTIKTKKGGFTLVEIMIVVAIIALLASVAVPSFLRARKRSQATAVKNDLRLIDAAVDLYAIENAKTNPVTPTGPQIEPYLKKGTRLQQQAVIAGATTVQDQLGNAITIPSIDSLPKIPAASNSALSDVANAAFWAPFSIN